MFFGSSSQLQTPNPPQWVLLFGALITRCYCQMWILAKTHRPNQKGTSLATCSPTRVKILLVQFCVIQGKKCKIDWAKWSFYYSATEHLSTSLNFHKMGLNVEHVLKFSTKQGYIDQLAINCVTYCRSGYSAAKSGLRHFHCLAWVLQEIGCHTWACGAANCPKTAWKRGASCRICALFLQTSAAFQEIH